MATTSRLLFLFLLLCYGKKLVNSTKASSESEEEFYSFSGGETHGINSKTPYKGVEPKPEISNDASHITQEHKKERHTTKQTKHKDKEQEHKDKKERYNHREDKPKTSTSRSKEVSYIVESPQSSDNNIEGRNSVSSRTKKPRRKPRDNISDTDKHVTRRRQHKVVESSESDDDICPTCHRHNRSSRADTGTHEFYEKITESHHTKKTVRREFSSGGNKTIIIKEYINHVPISDDSDHEAGHGKLTRHRSNRRLTDNHKKDKHSSSGRSRSSRHKDEDLETDQDRHVRKDTPKSSKKCVDRHSAGISRRNKHKQETESGSESESESESEEVEKLSEQSDDSEPEDMKKRGRRSRSSSKKQHTEYRDKRIKKHSEPERISKSKNGVRDVRNPNKDTSRSGNKVVDTDKSISEKQTRHTLPDSELEIDNYHTSDPDQVPSEHEHQQIHIENKEPEIKKEKTVISTRAGRDSNGRKSPKPKEDVLLPDGANPNDLNSDTDKPDDDDLEERLLKLMGHYPEERNQLDTDISDNDPVINDKLVGPSSNDVNITLDPTHPGPENIELEEQNELLPTTPEPPVTPTAPLEETFDQELESTYSSAAINPSQEDLEIGSHTYIPEPYNPDVNVHDGQDVTEQDVQEEDNMEQTTIAPSVPQVNTEAQDFLSKFQILTLDSSGGYEVNNSERYDVQITSYSIIINFKTDVNCSEVRFKDKTIWKHNDGNSYPRSIYVYLTSHIIFININNSSCYSYNYKADLEGSGIVKNETEIINSDSIYISEISDPSSHTIPQVNYPDSGDNSTSQTLPTDYYDTNGKRFILVGLDIEDKDPDNFFVYRDDERKTTVFIAKNSFLINYIKQSRVSTSSTSNIIDIWNTTSFPYSNRVLVTGIDDDTLKLNVYLINGTDLYFNKISYYPFLPKTNLDGLTNLLPTQHPANIKIITRSGEEIHVNDTTKYDVSVNDYLDYLTKPSSYKYKFKKDTNFVEFKVDDSSLWKYEDELVDIHPEAIFYHKQINLVLLEFDPHSYYIYKYSNNKWLLAYDYRLRQINIDNKNLITDQYEYKNDENKKILSYISKLGFPFNSIRQTASNIWTANKPSEYAKKVVVKETEKNEKYMIILLLDGNFLLYYKKAIDKEWEDITSTRVSFSNLKFFTKDGNDQNYAEKTIDHSTCDLDNDFLYFYKFGWTCTKVNYSGNTLWKHYDSDENSYPDRICLNLVDNALYITCINGRNHKFYPSSNHTMDHQNITITDVNEKENNDNELIHLQNDIHQTSNISIPSNKLINLDITKKESFEEYEYSEDSDIKFEIFTAKPGYGFKKIIKKKNSLNLLGSDEIIWEAKDNKEYLIKAITKSSDDKSKYLLMLPVVGDFLLYYKEHEDSEWSDITAMRLSFSNFRFYSTDDSDPKIKELGSSHYERTTYNFSFGYKFKEDVKCTLIKHNDVTLWKYTNEPNDPFPSGLYYALCTKNLRLCFTGISSPLLRTQIGLDIDDIGSTCYDMIQDTIKKTYTFIAKDQYLFRIVKQGEIVIWETMDLTDNVEKVFYEGIDQDKKKITIFMGNDTKLVFEKSSSTEPWKEFSSIYKPTDPIIPDVKDTAPTVPTISTEEQNKTKDFTPPVSSDVKNPDKIKIYTKGSDQPNDTTQYTLKKYGKFYKFEFKDDSKCIKVICGNTTWYEFGKNDTEGRDIKEIYYNWHTDYVYLGLFKTNFVPLYDYNEWKIDIGTDKRIADSKFKIAFDGSTNPNDTSKFDETNEGSFVKCQFKDNAKCMYISYEYHLIWNHNASLNSCKYPKCLYFHKLLKIVFAEFENDTFLFIRFDADILSWKHEKLEKDQSFDPNKFKVLTPDPIYNRISKKNDTDVIEKITFGSIVGYIVKKDVDYFYFKYDNNYIISLYNHYARPKFKDIYFLLNLKKYIISMQDKSLYIPEALD